MEAAVNSCQEAFKSWSQTSILTRQQIMFKYQQLIKDNMVGMFCEESLLSVGIKFCTGYNMVKAKKLST